MNQHWADHKLWIQLAKVQGHQLVPTHMNCSKKNIFHICNVLNISIEDFKDWSGLDRLVREYRNLNQFQKRNPNLPLFALQGQLLEMLYEKDIMAGMFNEE